MRPPKAVGNIGSTDKFATDIVASSSEIGEEAIYAQVDELFVFIAGIGVVGSLEEGVVAEGVEMDFQASSVSVSNQGCGGACNAIGIADLTVAIEVVGFAIVVLVNCSGWDDRPFVGADPSGIFGNNAG